MDDPGRDIFSVSRLATEIRATLENSFPLLWVIGEISNLAQPRSGHLYFTLKDAAAQVRCALFRSRRNLLRDQPSNGDRVLVRARISFYEARGDFQLIVEHLETAGDGALHQQFEALKNKLQAEGLFDAARKRPIPAFPQRIGIVTSSSGAALRDILHVLRRRAPWIPVTLYPAAVQGAAAPKEIIDALQLAQRRAECSLLILARGGGSAEDLAGFNDEGLARAIAAAEIPLICAVGHETDFTIADFVADRRAPTPSAAAELASPDTGELSASIDELNARLRRSFETHLARQQHALKALRHRLFQTHPERRLQQQQKHTDNLETRLWHSITRQLDLEKQHFGALRSRLSAQSPATLIRRWSGRLAELSLRLEQTTRVDLRRKQEGLGALLQNLNAVSPLRTLARGYAIARRASDGELLRDAAHTGQGEEITVQLGRGGLVCEVKAVHAGADDTG